MNLIKTTACVFLFTLTFFSCHNADKSANSIHLRSYQFGVIEGFAELVNAGVKKLALRKPLRQRKWIW